MTTPQTVTSPLEQLCELELVIRELYKIDSKLLAGQVISAYRENRKLISALERIKQDIIKVSKANSPKDKFASLPDIPQSRALPLDEISAEQAEEEFKQE